MECIMKCGEESDQNITYMASAGIQSLNLCAGCATNMWQKFKNTQAFQAATISPPKTEQEISYLSV